VTRVTTTQRYEKYIALNPENI